MKTNKPMYGITRIDRDNDDKRSRTHGWEVRIRRNKQPFQKLFSDSVCGGRNKALKAAKECRDEYCIKNPNISRKEFAQIKRRSTKSGIIGVRKITQMNDRSYGDYEYEYWIATWSPKPGENQKSKKFSINKYGEEEAFRLAVEAREKGLKKMWEPQKRRRKGTHNQSLNPTA